MHHIGLICPASAGHVNPMTTLGAALRRRGYRVSLISIPDSRAAADAAGLGFIALGADQYPPGSMERIVRRLEDMSREDVLHYSIQSFCDYARVALREARTLLIQEEVDAIVADQASGSGGTIAEALGIPYVTVANGSIGNREPDIPPVYTPWQYEPGPQGRERNARGYAFMDQFMKPVLDLVNGFRFDWGLPTVNSADDLHSSLAQIAQQPACFDFPRKCLPDNFHYTGLFLTDRRGDLAPFPFGLLNGKPLIYASLGTLHNRHSHLFAMIAEACQGLDAQLVISLGNRNAEIITGLAGTPIVVPYAPQLELMRRAKIFITNGGLNSVLEALTAGVPMVAIPAAGDPPGVGARIVYTGVGEVLDMASITTAELRTAVVNVLSNETYADAARRMQREISMFDGVERAADIAEQALLTRRPVLRHAVLDGAAV